MYIIVLHHATLNSLKTSEVKVHLLEANVFTQGLNGGRPSKRVPHHSHLLHVHITLQETRQIAPSQQHHHHLPSPSQRAIYLELFEVKLPLHYVVDVTTIVQKMKEVQCLFHIGSSLMNLWDTNTRVHSMEHTFTAWDTCSLYG